MPAPPYMRFYVDAYCKDTLALTLEEQGVYMRLLCTMWKHGGKILHNDSYIAKALPIHIHKWAKVKPQLMPFLQEHSHGYLTQKRLNLEYHFSSGDKKQNAGSTPPASSGATSHVTPQATGGATPQVKPQVGQAAGYGGPGSQSEEMHGVEEIPPGGVAHTLARALDLSRSKPKLNSDSRPLEDGDPDLCGKPSTDDEAAWFVHAAISAFEKWKLHPPADYSVVKSWIDNGCDLRLHVLPAVSAALNRHGGNSRPPKSWKYFTHEVYARKKKETHHG